MEDTNTVEKKSDEISITDDTATTIENEEDDDDDYICLMDMVNIESSKLVDRLRVTYPSESFYKKRPYEPMSIGKLKLFMLIILLVLLSLVGLLVVDITVYAYYYHDCEHSLTVYNIGLLVYMTCLVTLELLIAYTIYIKFRKHLLAAASSSEAADIIKRIRQVNSIAAKRAGGVDAIVKLCAKIYARAAVNRSTKLLTTTNRVSSSNSRDYTNTQFENTRVALQIWVDRLMARPTPVPNPSRPSITPKKDTMSYYRMIIGVVHGIPLLTLPIYICIGISSFLQSIEVAIGGIEASSCLISNAVNYSIYLYLLLITFVSTAGLAVDALMQYSEFKRLPLKIKLL